MKLGFGLPVGGAWARPANVARIARRAEALGYHSLWTFQRLLYPVAPRDEYYGAPGIAWPEGFQSTLDPTMVLAFAAAVTSRIRLGVSVLIMPFYAPVVLAKQLASLDVLSSGRLVVGLGLGWSRDEFEAAGAATDRRGARADEFIRCLKAAWADGEVAFAGAFYRIPRARVEPKPVQRPHPPLLVGGYHPAVLRRAATLADGYTAGNIPFAELRRVVGEVRRHAAAAGRDPAALAVVCRGAYRVTPEAQGPGRRPLWGSLAEVREDIARFRAAGATELFLDPNFQPGGAEPERVLGEMEALAPGGAR